MVVFTCNHCGDSLQKPKVEKHYQVACKTIKSLTCVDCFKDFKGQDYAVHTKCVSEEERYAAKGSVPAGVVKKGAAKQESWNEMIKSIIESQTDLKVPIRNLLNTISTYNNVPRKKVKFLNFIKSSSGGRANMRDVEDVWNVIIKYKNDQAKQKVEPEVVENKENGLKRKAENGVETVEKKVKIDEDSKFSYEENILEILNKKKIISLKKLQKKVMNAYVKHYNLEEATEKNIKKFHKKLNKINGINIDETKVTLAE